jgi:hypothetical protein
MRQRTMSTTSPAEKAVRDTIVTETETIEGQKQQILKIGQPPPLPLRSRM